jgi:hypothetical protein
MNNYNYIWLLFIIQLHYFIYCNLRNTNHNYYTKITHHPTEVPLYQGEFCATPESHPFQRG